jgi:hypothetical protein
MAGATTSKAQPDCLIKPDNQSVTGPTLPTAAVMIMGMWSIHGPHPHDHQQDLDGTY